MNCPNCLQMASPLVNGNCHVCGFAYLETRRLALDPQHGQALGQLPVIPAPRPDERITVENLESWMAEKKIDL